MKMKTTVFAAILLLTLLVGCTPIQAEGSGVTEAQPAAEISNEPGESISQLASEWEGLSLEEFFEASFRDLTLRSPEIVVEVGLTDIYGVTEVALDDVSDAYRRQTYQLVGSMLETLETYERAALSTDQQISYDIYQWYLQDILDGQAYMYHTYPATYFFVTSQPAQMIQFFTDIHPVRDLQDGRDFVTRLNLVGAKMDQIIEGLELRAEAGITAPEFAVDWFFFTTLNDLLASSVTDSPFYTALATKLDALPNISAAVKDEVLADAEAAIEETVMPAYRELADYLRAMEVYIGDDSGVWRLPDGVGYYAYRLRHFTTTSLSADEIHDLGLAELDRIHAEMQAIFDQLGYPADENLVQLFDRVAADGGLRRGDDIIAEYERLIEEAEQNLDAAFDLRPGGELVVLPTDYGGYYIPGSIDGSRPGAFYAGLSASAEYYAMPTLAYHEGLPGHHFQISIAQNLRELPAFRQGVGFTGFDEGWALYAEHLAWELGWYTDDPYGNLGRLQAAAFRAARLVVDTGLHARSWTFDEAQAFFTENTGFEVGDNLNPQNEIARYIVWPGQATAYYVGFLELLELRQAAMDQLGEFFDLKEFHRVILSNGAMPLEILERVVEQYIAETLANN